MGGSSVFVVPVRVLGQLGPLQQLLLESDVIMDMTESIFPPTSHPELSASCQSRVWFSSTRGTVPQEPPGVHACAPARLFLQSAGRLAKWAPGWPLWLTAEQLSWVWASTVAIGGPAGTTQKCKELWGKL